jgi:UDP-3-O-[3-hydroxymyristoyl] glucosamine N-acyltransferase
MADPRFYDNLGPFPLLQLCEKLETPLPAAADGSASVCDLASLGAAGRGTLSFFADGRAAAEFGRTGAEFCLTPLALGRAVPPPDTVLIPCVSVQHAFAAAARLFYPQPDLATWRQDEAIHPSAQIGENVALAPGVVIGPGVQIGGGTRIGPNAVLGRGVAVGRNCEIGANVTVTHALIGDRVLILPGAQIGSPGFGFANANADAGIGHTRIPQLGRVIVQDDVEIGACTTVDRGALNDTVIGEGSKLDNLVQVGHNVRIGRHCIVVSQVGISGSSTLGDFVTIGGQVGVSDHCRIGDGARIAGRTAMIIGQEVEGGKDYAGVPAKPLMDWIREVHAVAGLIKKPKRSKHE